MEKFAYTLIVVFHSENKELAQHQRNEHIMHIGGLFDVDSVIPVEDTVDRLSAGMAEEIELIEQRLKGQ